MADIRFLNPPGIAPPVAAYSQVARVRASSEWLFVAGQVGARPDWTIPEDFGAQCELVFANIGEILRACGADLRNVVQFTSYLVHADDIARFKSWRDEAFPRLFPEGRYPPNALLIVERLVQENLRVEVQAIAAI